MHIVNKYVHEILLDVNSDNQSSGVFQVMMMEFIAFASGPQ
jgi:hypothetical protein